MDESCLLKKLRQKDERALSNIIQLYTSYVSAAIQRIGGQYIAHEDAEEIAADVFYSVWKSSERIEEGKLKGFIGKVARCKTIDWIRAHKIELPLEEDILYEWKSTDMPEHLLLEKELSTVIKNAIYSMESPDQEIFLMHYYDCKSVKEISCNLDKKESAVKARLCRGREKLKQMLKEGGYFNENQ